MVCNVCGAASAPGALFCGTCGRSLTPGRAAARAGLPRKALLVVGAGVAVTAAVTAGVMAGPLRPAAAPPHPAPVTVTVSPSESAAPPVGPSPVAAATADLVTLYRTLADGVVRLETTACDGGGVGSGFLVAPDVVATVAHVVAGASTIAVRDGVQDASGVVVGLDSDRDLALVRLSHPMRGHVFTLASADPPVGTSVAAIGYPLAGPRSLSQGTVSGLGRDGETETADLAGLIQTDAAINPGNSGGPLFDSSGTVVGLVDAKARAEGIGYAISARDASPLLQAWRRTPRPVSGPDCRDAHGSPEIAVEVSVDADHPDAAGIAETLGIYATSINTGDYDEAYDALTQSSRSSFSRQEFAATHTSSYLFDVHVEGVRTTGDGVDQAVVRFTSVQDAGQGRDGQTCSLWRLRYRMVQEGTARWLIDRAVAESGYPRSCGG